MEIKHWVKLRGADAGNGLPQVGFVMDDLGKGKEEFWPFYSTDEQVTVIFPHKVETVKVKDIEKVTPYSFRRSLQVIHSFEGHHTSKGQFQFNIKHYWSAYDAPELAKKYLSEDEIYRIYKDIAFDAYKMAFKEDGLGSLPFYFPWWGDTYQAGRSGGWLVVSHKGGYGSDKFEAWATELEDAIAEVEELLKEAEPEEVDSLVRDLDRLKYELDELQLLADDLARSLQFIDDYIKYELEDLTQVLSQEETWRPYCAEYIEAETEKERREQVKANFEKGWELLKEAVNKVAPGHPAFRELRQAWFYMYDYVREEIL